MHLVDLSNTGAPNQQHTLADMRPPTYSRGLLGLWSFRDDVPNPKGMEVPENLEVRWGGGCGYPCGHRRLGGVQDVEQLRVDGG